MGFLSKLFGGDAGPPPNEPDDAAAGPSAAAPPSSPKSSSADTKTSAPRPPESARDVPPPPRQALPDAAPPVRVEPATPAQKAPATSAQRPPVEAPVAPPPPQELEPPRAAAPRLSSKHTERQRAAPAEPAIPGVIAGATVSRRPGEPPRRSPQLENSIITSAPELTGEPPRAAAAPRPAAAARPPRASVAEPPRAPAPDPHPPPRAPMSSVSGETGLLAASRTRKDRTKSPGFYSNMAPAYGSQTVSPSLVQASLKRTAVGVAPPPVPPPAPVAPEAVARAAGEPAPAKPPDPGLAGLNGAGAAALAPAAASRAAQAANDVDGAFDAAPAQQAADDDEKEDTAPGVGHTPSRHDPALRNEISERDLELLVLFGMDLGLGIVGDVWLTVAREAILRLKLTAIRLSRGPLDKALAQLGVELDGPSALSEERKSRIMQQLVLVDLALPRPIDISGQRQLRDRLIVQHLLGELSTTQPLVAQRLREDGSISLERISQLVPGELAARVGLSAEQIEEALGPFRDYLDERSRRGPEAAQVGKGRLLAQRLAELEASAEYFERVADGDDARAKREARRRRQSDIARVGLCLAEWGEAAILGEFERSSVQGKITRLRRWLTELPAS